MKPENICTNLGFVNFPISFYCLKDFILASKTINGSLNFLYTISILY